MDRIVMLSVLTFSLFSNTGYSEHTSIGKGRTQSNASTATVPLTPPEDLAQLIESLNSDVWRTRETAQRQIERMVQDDCTVNLSHVRRALQNPNIPLETQRRLTRVVQRATTDWATLIQGVLNTHRDSTSRRQSEEVASAIANILKEKGTALEDLKTRTTQADTEVHHQRRLLMVGDPQPSPKEIDRHPKVRAAQANLERVTKERDSLIKGIIQASGFTVTDFEYPEFYIRKKGSNRLYRLTFYDASARVQEVSPKTKTPQNVYYPLHELLNPMARSCLGLNSANAGHQLLKLQAPLVQVGKDNVSVELQGDVLPLIRAFFSGHFPSESERIQEAEVHHE